MNISEARRIVNEIDRYRELGASIAKFSARDVRTATAKVSEYEYCVKWLNAERHYKFLVSSWLSAEARYEAASVRHDEAAYRLAAEGWSAMKKCVPGLDGVDSFRDLAPSLQFRYALFAATVRGVELPTEVRSYKQDTGRTG